MNVFLEALAYAELRKIVLPDAYYDKKNEALRGETFSIASIESMSVLTDVLNLLNTQIKEGVSFKDFQDRLKKEELLPQFDENRLSIIYRTNMQSAFMSGQAAKIYDDDYIEYLQYDAIGDTRTRKSHRAFDGYIAPKDDPFWRTHFPPCGYRCRCGVIALSKRRAEQRLKNNPPRPEAPPDKGWEYDRTGQDGLQKGLDLAEENAKAALKQAEKAIEKLLKDLNKG